MNDQIREQLSAYLDGALSPADARAVEELLSRSEELRRELEELRAVSRSLKELPKAPLPAGFHARLQARRAGKGESRDWVLLPPAFRPVAFALSSAIVALVAWDRLTPNDEQAMMAARGDFAAKVYLDKGAAPAASVDLTAPITTGKSALEPPSPEALAQLDELRSKPRKGLGEPLGEGAMGFAGGGGASAGAAAPAAPPAAPAPAFEQAPEEKRASMSEQERSARNEQLFDHLEQEKKKMGIAKVLPRESDEERYVKAFRKAAERAGMGNVAAVRGARQRDDGSVALSAETPALMRAQDAGRAPALRRSSRVMGDMAGSLHREAAGLKRAWTAAGLPGEPPAIDFSAQMAVFLSVPGEILSVEAAPESLRVRYRFNRDAPPQSRVRGVTPTQLPVQFIAEQR